MLNCIIKGMKAIPMPTFENQYVLHKHTTGHETMKVIMMPIDDVIENRIENINQIIHLKTNKREYAVKASDILLYGSIDFDDENDINIINHFKFLSNLLGVGAPIPEHYDYEKHVAYSPKNYYLLGETWNPMDLVKFAHGSLNKPEKVVIFKYYD